MSFIAQGIKSLINRNQSAVKKAEEVDLPADQDLVRAGALLARERNFKDLVSVFVEQAQDISRVDLTAFYILKDADDRKSDLKLAFKRGRYPVPETISGTSELVLFLRECKEALIFNNKQALEKGKAQKENITAGFLREVLINPEMKSGMALPIVSPPREIGVMFAVSLKPCFFNRRRFHFLDSYTKLAAGAMQTSLLFEETKESNKKIDAMERYQDNVFNSMTNMIITTDASGKIYYFNEAAALSMNLREKDLGRNFDKTFQKSLSARTIRTITDCQNNGNEILGLEGIFKGDGNELDYSLNVSPLKTPRGKKEGLTLLFTNQTREKELKQTVQAVSDERRVIKDMFTRYMSQEVVASLMESPDNIKLGGDKRNATVFFADIRGYTSFSENRDPQAIVEILNEYFSAAVENIVQYKGYIDKFIGDCIMAVWGVPMLPDKDDAINAVSCALAIQKLVRSTKRKFFKKDASRLRVGIGVNTGPLVAGNLGSMQRMEYSVIGDTVNLASRLEGVAGPDEVIISKSTKEQLGNAFKLEKRESIRVKGKEKPIQIFNVLGLN
ncbi:MAG: PAS domain-containing protein [Treponema sp.]|nr:PAS domain-containing protein [Treponema sp.]MCL2272058.1 PAS domain-containing protein [Treponema sp.]